MSVHVFEGSRTRPMPARRRRHLPIVAGFLLAAALAACSGGDGDDDLPPVPAGPEAVFEWPVLTSEGGGTATQRNLFEDFDGDGQPDLVTLEDQGTPGIRIRHGDGHGRFVTHPAISPEGTIIGAFDIPGDSLPDLLIHRGVTGAGFEVLALRNVDGNSFVPFATIATGYIAAYTFVPVDLDGDGTREIIQHTTSGVVAVRVDASGAVTTQPLTGLPASVTGFQQAADVDGDGRTDLVYELGAIPDRHDIYRNDPNGGFVFYAGVRADPTFIDLDGDGDRDALRSKTDGIWWQRNDAGVFSTEARLIDRSSTATQTGIPFRIGFGDLDQDGRPDLVDHGSSRVYLQTAPLQFEGREIPPGSAATHLVDVTSDGLLDLVAVGSSFVNVLPQSAPGVLPNLPRSEVAGGRLLDLQVVPLVTGGPRTAVLFVDGLGPDPSRIVTLDFDGSVLSPRMVTLLPNGSVSLFAVTDLDRDGRTDYLIFDGTLPPHLWSGDGLGGFADAGPLPGVPSGNYALGHGDVDGDGDEDLIRVFDGILYINDGAGGFSQALGPDFLPFAPFSSAPVAARDFNADGIVDIGYMLARGVSPGAVAYGVGGTPPAFAAPIALGDMLAQPPLNTTGDVLDVDLDGDLDYVNGRDLSWQENFGGGMADAVPQPLAPGLSGFATKFGDFDGDGARDDLLVSNYDGAEVWLMTGPRTFVRPEQTASGPVNGTRIVIPDLNGDGLDDLVILAGSLVVFVPNSGLLAR